MSASTFNFATGFRGYHVRGEISKPSLNQIINFKQERNNRHDRFAILGTGKLPGTSAPLIVRHVPCQLSRFIWYAIKNGAQITAMVLFTKTKESPLVQGGLEIPVSIKI